MEQGNGLDHFQRVASIYRIIGPHQTNGAWERRKKDEGAWLMDIQGV